MTIVFDDNVDNFRPDQLPGATRSKIYNNLDNNNQQLAPKSYAKRSFEQSEIRTPRGDEGMRAFGR